MARGPRNVLRLRVQAGHREQAEGDLQTVPEVGAQVWEGWLSSHERDSSD